MAKRKKFTLMPVIALAALGLMISLPVLSSTRLYAASAPHYTNVTVHRGDTLWTIAAAHTSSGGDVQETIDQISAVNKMANASLQPGQHLRIPQ